MKIATPLAAILLAAFSVVTVRQAKRAWRDPDWEPASATESPRSPVALAILATSFAVLLAGGSVFIDLPAAVAKDAGAGIVIAGVAGLMFAVVTMETTKRYGWPRFLVPPPMRPGYGQAVSSGPAGPAIAEVQEAGTARAFEAARRAAHGVFPPSRGRPARQRAIRGRLARRTPRPPDPAASSS